MVCFFTETVLVLLDVTGEFFYGVFIFYFSLANFYSAFINLLYTSFYYIRKTVNFLYLVLSAALEHL